MCLKQMSSLFTIKSHTSRSPIRLFCALVLTPRVLHAVAAAAEEEDSMLSRRFVLSDSLNARIFKCDFFFFLKERKSDRFETLRCLSVLRITKAHAHKLCEKKKKKKKNNLISF
jgi:hypothetical protein